jgi:LacI family transcriptional regulator, gluconate utilization system Gnt-I transcriptional repressor
MPSPKAPKPKPSARQQAAGGKRVDRPRATGRVTLNDVAAAAGVSPITVSRALRGTRAVDADLVKQVERAARKLGYVPDPAARALASQVSNTVAVLVPLLSNTLFVDLIEAVQSTLMSAGYQTLIGVTHYNAEEEERLLRSYLAHRPAGFLLTGFDRTRASQQLLARSGVPAVHMMENLLAPDTYSVGFSQQAAGEAITNHLLSRKRKRIAFVGAQLDARVRQRLDGYRLAMRKAGLYDADLELLDPSRSSIGLGAALFEKLIDTHRDIDGIFFCNDDLAQGGLLAALRRGVRVPQKIAVAGFNDLAGSDQMPPPLTTIRTRRTEIGMESANLLLKLMRREPVPNTAIDVGYELVVRESA